MSEHWGAQLVSTRAALMRVARTRLRNDDWAADAVGAVMLAALEQPPPFDEPGRVRAWLFGMLRHKLVDVLREQAPQRVQHYGLDPDQIDPAETDGALADTGPGPEAWLAGRRFLEDLALALDELPALHRGAFLLREVLGEETEQACKALGITGNHLAVCVHRARTRLRQLLSAHAA
jgi:RNA polymerase sigma-70 factor (ECF subfamily)